MPELTDIFSGMVLTMRAVATAGVVHDRLRSAQTPEQLARLCKFSPDGCRGWVCHYLGATERSKRGADGQPLETNQIERLLRLRLSFVLTYDDDRSDGKTSTEVFNQMFEDMATELRRVRSFGFGRETVEHQLLQAESEFDAVQLAQALGSMHLGRCRLEIRTVETVVGC